MDIVFRFQESQKKSEKKQLEKQQRKERRRRHHSNSSQTSSGESLTDEEDDFALLTLKIKCKFTVRARKRCYLLQMDKKALANMRNEFPEVFEAMMIEEFQNCETAIELKTEMIIQEEQIQ